VHSRTRRVTHLTQINARVVRDICENVSKSYGIVPGGNTIFIDCMN
jgi:hypothetical protein